MVQLDNFLEPLIANANTWRLNPDVNSLPEETVVNQALLGMARIKLNR